MRLLTLGLAACSAAICLGCGNAPAITPVERASLVPFGTLVAGEKTIELQSKDSVGRLGAVTGALVVGERIIVLDATNAEARVFARGDGHFIGYAARGGDERGDLRRPAAIAMFDSASYVIFDEKRKLLAFRDLNDAILSETPVSGFLTGLVSIPGEKRVVFAGEIRNAKGDVLGTDVHEFDENGRKVVSYAKTADVTSDWQFRFRGLVVAVSGTSVATASASSNELRILDRRTGAGRSFALAAGWLNAPVWPKDSELKNDKDKNAAAERMIKWADSQRLVNGITGLSGGRFLVQVRAQSGGKRYFHYVLADTAGRTLAISQATTASIVTSVADTVYWIKKDGTGRTTLGSGVVRASPQGAGVLLSSAN
jgi:hypothetical protein